MIRDEITMQERMQERKKLLLAEWERRKLIEKAYENKAKELEEKQKLKKQKRTPEEIAAAAREYYAKNKEKIAAQKKEYRKKNKDKLYARVKAYRQTDKYKANASRYNQNYWNAHKEEIKERNKKYYAEHREEICAKNREKWRQRKSEPEDELTKIFNTIPDGLKRGEEKRVDCPRCCGKNKALWSRDSLNGHLWCVCDDCGVIISS